MARFQREEIAQQQPDFVVFPDFETPVAPAAGPQAVFLKKSLDRDRTDFDAGDRMTFAGQPQQIPAFTAQRREHSLARRHLQPAPKLLEVNVDVVLVKADFGPRPAFVPKAWVHGIPRS